MGKKIVKKNVRMVVEYQDVDLIGDAKGLFDDIVNMSLSLDFKASECTDDDIRLYYIICEMIMSLLFIRPTEQFDGQVIDLPMSLKYQWVEILSYAFRKCERTSVGVILQSFYDVLKQHRKDGPTSREMFKKFTAMIEVATNIVYGDILNEEEGNNNE